MTREGNPPRVAVAYARQGSDDDLRYLKAVEHAGGQPLSLPAGDASWVEALERAHALLLIGGGDVSSELYGGLGPSLCLHVDSRRDQLELQAFRHASALRLPVLGICRGLRLLNLAYDAGGRRGVLLQDLPDFPLQHRVGRDGRSSYHEVEVLPRTRLAAAVGRAGAVGANSRHHQGLRVEQLADGLVVSALAPDGLVEGLEAPGDWFLVGVQCHPERPGEAAELAQVFPALVAAARAWRRPGKAQPPAR